MFRYGFVDCILLFFLCYHFRSKISHHLLLIILYDGLLQNKERTTSRLKLIEAILLIKNQLNFISNIFNHLFILHFMKGGDLSSLGFLLK